MKYWDINGIEIEDFASISFFNVKNYSSFTQRDLPNLYQTKADCCGCYACYNKCVEINRKAITMQNDKEGFEYPTIDASKCICCKSCIRVCQMQRE